MQLEKIICKELNLKKYLKASYNKQGEITVEYRLSVPSWCNDVQYLGNNEKRSVIYARNKKYDNDGARVTCKNINTLDRYGISKNKFYTESHTYSIVDLIGKDLNDLFYKDYLDTFRELKSNILLEKIGDLSKQWDLLTSGKENTMEYHSELQRRSPYIHPYAGTRTVETLPF